MYEKNLPNRAGLTFEFEDGVTAFKEWAKSQHAYKNGRANSPTPAEEDTSRHRGDAAQINWAQRMVSNAARPAFWSSTYNQDGGPDDGTRSCPTDVGRSSYYYGGGPYDYVFGLADRFHDIVHVAEQPLWNNCTQSQLGAVAESVDTKADGYISQRIYDRISQWADHISPRDHTLPLDYYNTKKLIKNLGLPMEKIDACRNSCMLYWNDDIDLELLQILWRS
ncbi:UNVERIFIED_CONTAM: hypothetical protein Slati_2900900 [Sesamum latifolium]|uniref:Uncharacterized protein n=1 Tax=Sesamum latifolium TaxID=2727402 RepID=A0AAW2VG28_9LAMI